MRIVAVIPTFARGGAETVLSRLVVAWRDLGHTVTSVVFDRVADELAPPDVSLELAPANSTPAKIARVAMRARRLRAVVRQCEPDVVVAFHGAIYPTLLLCTSRALTAPSVVSVRINPRHLEFLQRCLLAGTLRSAQAVVANASQVADLLARWRWVDQSRLHVISNPLMPPTPGAFSTTRPPPRPYLLAVGRLDPQKGFDVLLRSFANLRRPSAAGADLDLVVLGEGGERPRLERLRSQLGLDGCVWLPGHEPNVRPYLAGCAAFVLSSRYEGSPNALAEAMASGCRIVAADCDFGPRELLRDYPRGRLCRVDDVQHLAEILSLTLKEPTAPVDTGAILTRFSLGPIARQWLDLFGTLQPR